SSATGRRIRTRAPTCSRRGSRATACFAAVSSGSPSARSRRAEPRSGNTSGPPPAPPTGGDTAPPTAWTWAPACTTSAMRSTGRATRTGSSPTRSPRPGAPSPRRATRTTNASRNGRRSRCRAGRPWSSAPTRTRLGTIRSGGDTAPPTAWTWAPACTTSAMRSTGRATRTGSSPTRSPRPGAPSPRRATRTTNASRNGRRSRCRAGRPWSSAPTRSRLGTIRAARNAAEELGVPLTGEVMLSGYSQGGHASMAAHRAIERDFAGEIGVVAGAHLAGPYNMSGSFKDADLDNPIAGYQFFVPFIVTAWQKTYGGIYDDPSEIFKAPYAGSIHDLLPSPTLTYTTLVSTGALPGGTPKEAQDALFHLDYLQDV